MSPIDLAVLNSLTTGTAFIVIPAQAGNASPAPDPVLVAALNATLPGLLDEALGRSSQWSFWHIFFVVVGVLILFAVIGNSLCFAYDAYVSSVRFQHHQFALLHHRFDLEAEGQASGTCTERFQHTSYVPFGVGEKELAEPQRTVCIPRFAAPDGSPVANAQKAREEKQKESSEVGPSKERVTVEDEDEDENDPLLKAQ